jgi:hypothetical protein
VQTRMRMNKLLGGRVRPYYHGMSCIGRPHPGAKSDDELKANPENHADLGKEERST